MAFMIGKHLKFIDSFQFMSSSLAQLVDNLPRTDFKYVTEYFGDQATLMIRKGVYPYDYMGSFERLEEMSLPLKSNFYSKLNDEHISDDDYKHAQEVWRAFNMTNMGDYHDLYLTFDVLLLADVFESFRKTCLQHYQLDPPHYFTSPGLAWDLC